MWKASALVKARYLVLLAGAAAGGFAAHSRREKAAVAEPGELTVVCTGSSHTVGMVPGQSYPEQLERLLQESHPRTKVRVINAAYPGEEPDQILAELPRILQEQRPDYVALMMTKYAKDGWDKIASPRPEAIRIGTTKAIELARAAGARVILVDQPLHRSPLGEDLADPVTREVAAREKVPLADLAGLLAARLPDLETFYFRRPDGQADPDHLNEKGNALLAEQLRRLIDGAEALPTATPLPQGAYSPK